MLAVALQAVGRWLLRQRWPTAIARTLAQQLKLGERLALIKRAVRSTLSKFRGSAATTPTPGAAFREQQKKDMEDRRSSGVSASTSARTKPDSELPPGLEWRSLDKVQTPAWLTSWARDILVPALFGTVQPPPWSLLAGSRAPPWLASIDLEDGISSSSSSSSGGASAAAAPPDGSPDSSRQDTGWTTGYKNAAGSSSSSSSSASSSGTASAPMPDLNAPGESVEWVNMCWRKSWRVYQRGLERWIVDLLQPVFDGLVRIGLSTSGSGALCLAVFCRSACARMYAACPICSCSLHMLLGAMATLAGHGSHWPQKECISARACAPVWDWRGGEAGKNLHATLRFPSPHSALTLCLPAGD